MFQLEGQVLEDLSATNISAGVGDYYCFLTVTFLHKIFLKNGCHIGGTLLFSSTGVYGEKFDRL